MMSFLGDIFGVSSSPEEEQKQREQAELKSREALKASLFNHLDFFLRQPELFQIILNGDSGLKTLAAVNQLLGEIFHWMADLPANARSKHGKGMYRCFGRMAIRFAHGPKPLFFFVFRARNALDSLLETLTEGCKVSR